MAPASETVTVQMAIVDEDLRADRACFDGMMLSALAFGALVMLHIQLTQVLLRKPKRGRTYWYIVAYSSALVPLSVVAFAGKMRFAEMIYVTHRNYPSGPKGYYIDNYWQWPNIMSQGSAMATAWVADLLMFYRIKVLWNDQCRLFWLLLVPFLLYLGRIAMAIPILISTSRSSTWLPHTIEYLQASASITMVMNIYFTVVISLRIFAMRHKAERVLGRLQASLYNSSITMFVESGALFTIWSVAFLVAKLKRSWVEDVFLQPYSYIIALTRMLIILRMAQDRAWSNDLITAADTGVLDWQVSSSNSVSLGPVSSRHAELDGKKVRETSSIASSVR